MRNHFLAIDLGASSGRAILGSFEQGAFSMKEISRFPNTIQKVQGKLYWDVYALHRSVLEALRYCVREQIELTSVGIDTWGVDYGFLGKDGTLLGLPRAYRDPYTEQAPEQYFEAVSRAELYSRTGIQIMPFNSVFQLYAAKRDRFSPLEAADKLLFMPDLLSYLLTGNPVCESTIASTGQVLNPYTRSIDERLLAPMGLKATLFAPMVHPGAKIGTLHPEVQQQTGASAIPVVAVAGHDTASAVASVPTDTPHFAYLSSGTWSLMGIETKDPIINEQSQAFNFTNEGGVEGTIRVLKNICGMWLLEECRREWKSQGTEYSYQTLVEMAAQAPAFRSFVNPDDPAFAHPTSMLSEIHHYCLRTGQAAPANPGQVVRLIYESLALRYRAVLEMLQALSPHPIEKLYVIGGGARNALLNQFAANSLRIPVISGPAEATAIGNIMIQAKAAGLVSSLPAMRALISESIECTAYTPQASTLWEEAYLRFSQLTTL